MDATQGTGGQDLAAAVVDEAAASPSEPPAGTETATQKFLNIPELVIMVVGRTYDVLEADNDGDRQEAQEFFKTVMCLIPHRVWRDEATSRLFKIKTLDFECNTEQDGGVHKQSAVEFGRFSRRVDGVGKRNHHVRELHIKGLTRYVTLHSAEEFVSYDVPRDEFGILTRMELDLRKEKDPFKKILYENVLDKLHKYSPGAGFMLCWFTRMLERYKNVKSVVIDVNYTVLLTFCLLGLVDSELSITSLELVFTDTTYDDELPFLSELAMHPVVQTLLKGLESVTLAAVSAVSRVQAQVFQDLIKHTVATSRHLQSFRTCQEYEHFTREEGPIHDLTALPATGLENLRALDLYSVKISADLLQQVLKQSRSTLKDLRLLEVVLTSGYWHLILREFERFTEHFDLDQQALHSYSRGSRYSRSVLRNGLTLGGLGYLGYTWLDEDYGVIKTFNRLDREAWDLMQQAHFGKVYACPLGDYSIQCRGAAISDHTRCRKRSATVQWNGSWLYTDKTYLHVPWYCQHHRSQCPKYDEWPWSS